MAALKENSQLFSDGTKKADILSRQFASAIKPLAIDQYGVEKLLQGLNFSKASGPDNLACRQLRELAHELSPLLTCIYKQSIETSTLPVRMDQRCMPKNYHPVSLTCLSCNILEHIICKHFRTHLEQYGILTPLNHGFRAKFSCETQLLLTLQDLLLARVMVNVTYF